jgi:hypothetical protein
MTGYSQATWRPSRCLIQCLCAYGQYLSFTDVSTRSVIYVCARALQRMSFYLKLEAPKRDQHCMTGYSQATWRPSLDTISVSVLRMDSTYRLPCVNT